MSSYILRTENLTKSYQGLTAVDGCTIAFETGKITGLIGPNGAGKSTLFQLMAGTEQMDSGEIYLEDNDISSTPPHTRYHKGISRTFQLAHEFARMTVWENLLVSAPLQSGEKLWNNWLQTAKVKDEEQKIREQALEILDFLTLSHLRDAMAGTLSGGQKKLLELGRIMMGNPKVILLDEIAAGINPLLMEKIGEVIKQLNAERGYSFCLIEHDMNLIESMCERVIVLARGKVLTEGTLAELRQHEEVVESYLGGGN